ncbi:MAG: 16S rRNA (cytosine(967)-C(5))-methyltransferase RsmB [Clostridia bacterium]|nr:16S rRNA (cytosine(967)-C(5))-methyltransferase RsmB [Deltaproteobacteria bacterium]
MNVGTTHARRIAHEVLLRVLRDHAYADRALDAALERSSLPERDRALATELVYGSLRNQQRLDFVLGQLAERPLRKLHPAVLVALRLGAYQILETRIPAPAAVHETVSLVRSQHKYAAGFANALLRKLATLNERGELPRVEDVHTDLLDVLAVQGSHPRWFLERVANELGIEEARELVAANNKAPPLSIRVNRLRASRDEVVRALTDGGAEVEVPTFIPEGLLARGTGYIRNIAAFNDGHFTVQDLAAQLIGELCGPAPKMTVLDACAAPGGKSTHLAELMDDEGKVIAIDINLGRTRLIAESAGRLGLKSVVPVAADASDGAVLLEKIRQVANTDKLDLALVDAPCSGMGTLRRNPELRGRLESTIPLMTRLQDAILDAVAPLIRIDGALVFAVCTVTREEGVERIEAFLDRHPEFEGDWPKHNPVLRTFMNVHEGKRTFPFLRTWPQRHDVDGFFACRMVKRRTIGAAAPVTETDPT